MQETRAEDIVAAGHLRALFVKDVDSDGMPEMLEAIQGVFLNVFVFSFCHKACKDLAQPERPIYNVMEVVLLGFVVGPVELHEQPVMRLGRRFQDLCESSSCCWPRSQYTNDVPESAETLAFCGGCASQPKCSSNRTIIGTIDNMYAANDETVRVLKRLG